jgi:hypothetical protein
MGPKFACSEFRTHVYPFELKDASVGSPRCRRESQVVGKQKALRGRRAWLPVCFWQTVTLSAPRTKARPPRGRTG